MKIKPEHAEFIRQAMLSKAHLVPAHKEALTHDPRVKDLEMRLRWDLLRATVHSHWICDNLYPYAKRAHIDTLLRRVMKEIES